MKSQVTAFIVALAACSFFAAAEATAQEIILRDLTRIRGVAITGIDAKGVSLVDGRLISWDRILQGKIDDPRQVTFDELRIKFGLDLFRLKHRIKSGNITGAFVVAKSWYQNDQKKFSGAEANFLVSRSVMLGRTGQLDSATAVEPMIRAMLLQQECSPEFLAQYSTFVFSDGELASKICDDFMPVWGDVETVKRELERVENRFNLDDLTKRYPALAVYLSSMAIHIQQRERATKWIAALGSDAALRPWQRVLGSDLSRTRVKRLIDELEGSSRVTAMYWWATTKDQSASQLQRLLTLLKIVAAYSQQFPDLAARARMAAVDLTEDLELVKVLRQRE